MTHYCETCHTARQQRQAQESQAYQHTGHVINVPGVSLACDDCGVRTRSAKRFEYMTAHELLLDLTEAREKLKKLEYSKPDFPLTDYHHAADMMEHVKSFPAVLSDPEAFRQVISYAAELEEML